MIASASGSEAMLLAIHPDPMVVQPAELGWSGMRKEAQRVLRETRRARRSDARRDRLVDPPARSSEWLSENTAI